MAVSTRGRPVFFRVTVFFRDDGFEWQLPCRRPSIESDPCLIGLLVPSPPWSGRLASVSAKAISIVHPDGAMVSVVGNEAAMEARALMPSEKFCELTAQAESLLGDYTTRCLEESPREDRGQVARSGPPAAEPPRAGWDGRYLWLGASARQLLVRSTSPASERSRGAESRRGAGTGFTLDCGQFPGLWDPRPRLAEAARLFLRCFKGDGVLAAGVRALLAEAYAAGRRAEGLHGSGAFARGFRRLEADPGFPAVAVGFGPGTTPAGDDWLAGYLVALDLHAGGPGKAAPGLRQEIRLRLEQTTAAGRTLLLGALAGAPPEYLVALAEAAADWVSGLAAVLDAASGQVAGQSLEQAAGQVLCSGRLRDAVSICLTHGATSGEDALAGFVYGLENAEAAERPMARPKTFPTGNVVL